MVMGLSVEKLTQRGVLPPIPESVPPSWGVWLWTQPWTLHYKPIYYHVVKEIKEIIDKRGINDTVEKQISAAKELAQKGRYGEALAKIERAIDTYKIQ